ncbi:EpsG family protein [Shewanella japonica]|uniref:EpsG family protein n=1 Tax=Shewanella japonica TaxID=93973 RepID=A0ABM6JIU6_9GAMM|nr:EpsG family protein [Shewanella japonica]ARD21661.1 hypothetical protein SJ2017_1337 [Shewanella japonica]
MIYFFPLFLLCSTAFLDFFSKNVRALNYLKFSICCFSIVFLFTMLSLKGNIEPDYISYFNIFNNTPSLFDFNADSIAVAKKSAFGIEYGILIINGFVKIFSDRYQLLLLVVAFLNIFLIIKISSFFKECRYFVIFALVALFYQGIFVQIRFALSCFFLYYSILLYLSSRENNLLKVLSIINLFFGAILHNVWVVTIFMPLLLKLKGFIRKYILFLFLATLPLVWVDLFAVAKWIVQNLFPRYNVYILDYDGYKASPLPYFWRLFLNVFLILLLYFKESNRYKEFSNVDSLLLSFLFMNLLIWAVGYNFPILYRVSWFFDIGYVFFIVSFYKSHFMFKKITFFVIFSLYLFYRVYNGMDSYDEFYYDWV